MTRRYARSVAALLFAAILAATSLTMAVARGQARVAGEIVICTGYGMTTISVDDRGQPTGPVHLCPDMVLGMMAAVGVPSSVPPRPEGQVVALVVPEPAAPASRAVMRARARGPPLA